MRLRTLLLSAMLTAGLGPSAIAQESDILPLAMVTPGMTGYGLSVFKGTEPERFEFTVRGKVPNFRGMPEVIVVQLSGGPIGSDGRPLFENSQIFSGMSGSPMFIDDKLIGGLAMAPDFATAAKTLVTPIGRMREMGRILEGERGEATDVGPGASLAMCFVYGEIFDRCAVSTATARMDGLLFKTAHGYDMPFGKYHLPVFEMPIADLLETDRGASKLSGYRGAQIGTVRVHGMFGFAVVEGQWPRMIPVRLVIEDVYDVPKVGMEYLSPETQATGSLREGFITALDQLPVDAEATRLDVTIHVKSLDRTIHFVDTHRSAIISLERILDSLLKQEGDALEIDIIELRYSVLRENELWIPQYIAVEGKKDDGVIAVIAQRGRDNEVIQLTEKVDVRPFKPYKKKRLEWLDGTNLQNRILSRMPVRNALDLLDRIQEREALYLVWLEDVEDMIPDVRRAAAGTVERVPEVRILYVTDFGGRRLYMGDKGESLDFSMR